MNKAATVALFLPVRLSAAGAVAPYKHGRVVASQFASVGGPRGAPLINPWPFLLCQKPIVAASPPPRDCLGGCGVSATLAEQLDWQPVAAVTVTKTLTGLLVSVPACHLKVVEF